ncbi:hypothetical protein [Treponema pectinovorum]|uniref:hypothetical protein n=1 Tax=Treponema pectinovorum TaxID=164 RepID=UPI003D8C50C2
MDKTICVKDLPKLVNEGKISILEAKDFLWCELYKNPENYCLSSLDEDQKSEFLISISSKFSIFIEKYKEGSVPFDFFLRACIKRAFASWIRKELKKIAGENCLNENNILDYEQRLSEQVIEPVEDEKKICGEKIKLSPKKKQILKDLIHICACKACNEIDDEIISKVANFLEIEVSDFKSEINQLRAKTEGKLERRKTMIQRRNQAFFFRKKFLYQLNRLEKNTASYSLLLKKYKAQTQSWEKINEELEHRFFSCPTTKEISFTSGIKFRQVSYYLNHQKKRKDIFSFIECP